MKITRIEPPQGEAPAAMVEVSEPEPAPVETPAQAEERTGDDAALSGTRALVAELTARLATVTAQAADHRQAAEQPFTGEPAALAAHLATTEQHRADADRLAVEAETLQRQCTVAAALLDKLEQEQADDHARRTQAAGRKLLTAALERYAQAATEFGDAVLSVGAAAIAANVSSSFTANIKPLLLPDLPALGKLLPALPGFKRQREGQAVSVDPAFSQRMNELLRNAP